MSAPATPAPLRFGWAETEITPQSPSLIAGQFHARLSEGVRTPLTATALAIDGDDEQAVLVSCDLVSIPNGLRERTRGALAGRCPALPPEKVVFNATHTHTGPEVRPYDPAAGHTSAAGTGVELAALSIETYLETLTEGLANLVSRAWEARSPGAFAFGQGTAVVGHNRRWVDRHGTSTMYGNTQTNAFSHIEGAADHTLGVIAVYDKSQALTGLVVNVPCPSQVSENDFVLDADYWHETRALLREHFGKDLFILPQCSAAGDQSPRRILDKSPEARMRRLSGRSERDVIAARIADAVGEVLSWAPAEQHDQAIFSHSVMALDLPLNRLTEQDIADATAAIAELQDAYDKELARLEAEPARRQEKRWYMPATWAFRRMSWFKGVLKRAELQKTAPTQEAEVHVLRLGPVAIATNPFEYYLDFGTAIKAQSPADQTFLVQLAGQGTYVPSERSLCGGGYGSVPASNPIGPAGGWLVADKTVERLAALFAEQAS